MSSTATDRIDGLATSVAIKAPCRAGTTGAITLSGTQTVDGVALAVGDRVLVMNQADQTTNGIYFVQAIAWVRDVDFDGNRDAVTGTMVFVTTGTVNGATFWKLTTTDNPVVFGTSNITFAAAGFAQNSGTIDGGTF